MVNITFFVSISCWLFVLCVMLKHWWPKLYLQNYLSVSVCVSACMHCMCLWVYCRFVCRWEGRCEAV